MAADLHIHVFEGITEDDLADFFSSTLGTRYFSMARAENARRKDRELEETYRVDSKIPNEKFNEYWSKTLMGRINNTPNIWIGEVSWLKAALFGDEETFIPNAVGRIHELIGQDLPILDEKLKGEILSAMKADNTTGYSLTEENKIDAFLNEHMGKRLFTVSW